MRFLARAALASSLAACIQVSDRHADTQAAKIDTSSGLLATATGRVDSAPASTNRRTPPLIGAESTTVATAMSADQLAGALSSDTAVALGDPQPGPDNLSAAPATAPPDLAALRRTMQVPVAGVAPAMLHDSYDEMRGGTRRHEALDIPAARGTQVVSATGGRVLRLFNSKAGGLMVYATDSSEHFILMYGHLDAYQPGLAAGQPLRRGQPLGIVGTTGDAPANLPHLHFAMARTDNVKDWWKGAPINPYPLLRP